MVLELDHHKSLGITGLLQLSVTKSVITGLVCIKLPVNLRHCAVLEIVWVWESGYSFICLVYKIREDNNTSVLYQTKLLVATYEMMNVHVVSKC